MFKEEFLAKYPLFKESKEIYSYLGEDAFYLTDTSCETFSSGRLFLHELCHFLEREDNKVFLENFGMARLDGKTHRISWNSEEEYIKKIHGMWQRESRVIALEHASGYYEKYFANQYLKLTHMYNETMENLVDVIAKQKEYLESQKVIYTKEKYEEIFSYKYALLERKLGLVLA